MLEHLNQSGYGLYLFLYQDRHIQYSPALKLSRKQELRFADLKHCLRRYGRGDMVRSTTGQLGGPSGGEGQRGAKAKQHQRKSLKLT